jgi:class 3 adenylate cyclase
MPPGDVGSNAPIHAAQAGLNTSSQVTSKRVSLLVFNAACTHALASANSAKFTQMQTELLTVVGKHVRENKGVIDAFQGDHVVASFNAVGTTASHGKRAALAALGTIHALASDAGMPRVTAGLSSGMACVGNMGTKDMRRFCIVGPVFVQAMLLERMCKMIPGVKTMFASNILAEISLEMYAQIVDIAMLPGFANPMGIVSLEMPKQMENNEWMYMLAEGESSDPFANINDAFVALLASNVADARAALLKHNEAGTRAPEKHKAALGEASAQRLTESISQGKPLTEACSLGRYYDMTS